MFCFSFLSNPVLSDYWYLKESFWHQKIYFDISVEMNFDFEIHVAKVDSTYII